MIKTYEAVVEGSLPTQTTLIDYLIKDEKTNTSSVTDSKRGKYCELAWELIRSNSGRHHLRIHLKTGRSHQIRVQFASRGCPLYGDQRYNPNAKTGQQLAVWTVELSVQHPITHYQMNFTSAPLFFPKL